jgi:hypothetical protein
MSNAYIIWEGESQIDGSPIFAVVTGLETGGKNTKIGKMAAVYILRADMSPMQASQTGADYAICGDCKHRGTVEVRDGVHRNVGRSCYVTLFHGPRVVYKAYKDGVYPRAGLSVIAEAMRGALVRLGAYGDPAAVPLHVWQTVLAHVKDATGYTHQWREHPELAAYCMASCDTSQEREEAKRLGFRTFRIRTAEAPTLKGEGKCPASKEMGKVTQCNACMLCSGTSKGHKSDITIVAHGPGAKHFNPEPIKIFPWPGNVNPIAA